MTIAVLLRVKNEARFIGRVLGAVTPIATGGLFVLDDHSTDETASICLTHGALLYPSPFKGFDETRDNNFLVERAMEFFDPDWLLRIDGDEELERADLLSTLAKSGEALCYSFNSPFLWDSEHQVRVDRWYADRWIPCFFSTRGTDLHYSGGHIHTMRTPGLFGRSAIKVAGPRLIHYGYLDRCDRLRKYAFYNRVDPENEFEDRYRHIVQGDIPEVPADAELKWAGPLKFAQFERYESRRAV